MTGSWPNSGVDLHLAFDAAAAGRRAGLERALREAVRDGRLVAGARLPPTRQLAGQLGVSRGTVRAAYDQLIAEGYLAARQGSGTTVARLPDARGGHGDSDPGRPGAAAPAAASAGPSAHPQGRPQDAPGPRHDLRPGSPDVSAFPASAWLRSARRALAEAPADVFARCDPRGRVELRTELAEYLGRARGVVADPDHLVVTTGYVQSLALLTKVLADTGTTHIAMEDPGSPLHRSVARRNGLTVVPLPVDVSGATVPGHPAVGAVEVTPAHQYPTGETMAADRRRALISWARAGSGLIVENDYDGEFRYDRQPVGAIQGTAPDQVAYLGTASKTLAPALRLGWMVLPPRLAAAVADAKHHEDRHTEVVGQLTLADFIATHAYDRHVRSSRLRYQRRRDRLVTRLRAEALPGLTVHGIAAGLHVLIRLPEGVTEESVLAIADRHGLGVGRLGDRWHAPGGHGPGIVVGYGTPYEHAYPAAVEALIRVLREAFTRRD